MALQPFWTYYGGKWRAAPQYPRPEYKTIIEPFAGAAGYSLRYPHLDIHLFDKDETVCGLWQYLIRVSPQEIEALPDIGPDQTVDDLPNLSEEARWLIGWWCNKGTSAPCKTPSTWMKGMTHEDSFWGAKIRRRIARQVPRIRHWKVTHGTYRDAPDVEATWFIDPPYQAAGMHYREGAANIDFPELGRWCQSRRGQVMVCENEGADWLPFRPFMDIKANPSKTGGKTSAEVIWSKSESDSDFFY